jgi:FkbM family methyltransferase
MREAIKSIIHIWPWPLTRNEKYDRQTRAILKKVLAPDSICIDVGCFRGEILREMLIHAPQARHMAFEPIPAQYEYLKIHFGSKADIYPYALGNENKETTFQHVITNPTYSGLRQRSYVQEELIEEITVHQRRLDDIVNPEMPIRLIKIDVEGGELDVILGGVQTLKKWKPFIIFEHGAGGADNYGVRPEDLYNVLVNDIGYSLCLMGDYLKHCNAHGFTKHEFSEQFWSKKNCYFLALKN